MTIDDKIRELRQVIAGVQAKKARAAVELDAANSRLADARRALAEEFSVTTSEEARAVLAGLKEELAAAVASIEADLTQAGA